MSTSSEPKPCVGCGYCCILTPCVYSLAAYGKLDCPALRWNGQRYVCDHAGDWRQELGIGAGCCSTLQTWRHDVRKRRIPSPRERGIGAMGIYLDGATRGKPHLPRVGKADALIEHYQAKEVETYLARRILDCDYPVPDTGPVLIIVMRRNPLFDAALYVDEKEHRYLQEYPQELAVPHDLKPLRYLLVPREIADELAYPKPKKARLPEGEKNEQSADRIDAPAKEGAAGPTGASALPTGGGESSDP